MRFFMTGFLCAVTFFGFAASGHAQTMTVRSNQCTPSVEHGTYKVECAVSCPIGSKIIVGGCGADGVRPWPVYKSLFSDNGWRCGAYDPLSVGNKETTADGDIRLNATANCQSSETSPKGAWTLPASGDLIAIANSGTGLTNNIDRAFLVCNSLGPIEATVHIYKADTTTQGYYELPVQKLAVGKCLTINRPAAVVLANYVDQVTQSAGFFSLSQPTLLLTYRQL